MNPATKRSADGELLVSKSDYNLIVKGRKICTSRYGIRTAYTKGDRITIRCNEDEKLYCSAAIRQVEYKELNDVTKKEAWYISEYGVADHVLDFHNIYSTNLGWKVTGDTLVTVIWFKVGLILNPDQDNL